MCGTCRWPSRAEDPLDTILDQNLETRRKIGSSLGRPESNFLRVSKCGRNMEIAFEPDNGRFVGDFDALFGDDVFACVRACLHSTCMH